LTQTSARHRVPNALVGAALDATPRVLGTWGLLLLLCLPGLARLRVDTSTDSVLDRSDPAWAFYQESQERFGGDEILVVALQAQAPFDPAALREVSRLTDVFEGLPGVRRVDSLATVPVVYATPDGVLELHPALERAPEEPAELERHVRRRLARDRIAPRNLVSDDGRTLAINIVLEKGSESGHESLLARVHDAIGGSNAQVSGVPVFRVETNGRTRTEIVFFAPLTGALLVILLGFAFRSLAAALLSLVPGIVGTWVMLSAMGALSAPLTITTMVLPSIILALGCAYSMHLQTAAAGASGRDGLREAMRPVALPVALSGLTTVVGFVSIALVRIDAVRFVAVFGSLGVLVVTAATLTLVPVGLRLWPPTGRPPRSAAWIRDSLCPLLLGLAQRRRPAVFAAWLFVFGVCLVGSLRLDVDTDATQWLPPGNPVRDAYDTIRARLSGISPVNVVVEAPRDGSVLEPELLDAIDRLSAHLESLPDVGRSVSIADPLRQMQGGFLGVEDQPLPDDEDLAEQYLLLLDSVEQIDDLIVPDRSSANIVLRVDHNGSSHLLAVADEAQRWWQEQGVAGARARPTGIMFEYARAEDEIAMGQIRGLSLALGVIGVVLLAIFRWFRLALIALVPNIVPLGVVFGLMGLAGIPIDAGTVLVGSLALGVAVDDTIHVSNGFFERVGAGLETPKALDGALRAVLLALVFTTVIVSLAFLVLAFSEFTFIRNLGLLTAAIMVLCLLADVTLLPALLLAFGGRWRRQLGGPTEGSTGPGSGR
jgi:predicted RND superfamily exporter protein